jgi:hypothetical protein
MTVVHTETRVPVEFGLVPFRTGFEIFRLPAPTRSFYCHARATVLHVSALTERIQPQLLSCNMQQRPAEAAPTWRRMRTSPIQVFGGLEKTM